MCHRAGPFLLLVSFAATSFCTAQSSGLGGEAPPLQISTGQSEISGSVQSVNGAPLHDIRIEVRAPGTTNTIATCYSNQSGGFTAQNLTPGNYEVIATDGLRQAHERVEVAPGVTNVRLHMSRANDASPKIGTISVIELKTPERARGLTAKAHNAIRKNHRDEAKKEVEKALAIAPDYPDALTTRAVLELADDKMQSAKEDLDHAVKIDPSYGPAYLVLGAVFNQLGRYDEALLSLERGSTYDPKSWQCAFEASKAWMGKHDYENAVAQLNRAERLGASRALAPIHLLRGYALIAEKRFEQARRDFESYLSAEPHGQHAGMARAALAKISTYMAQAPDSLAIPAMTGASAAAQ